jgi:hypothetical protein
MEKFPFGTGSLWNRLETGWKPMWLGSNFLMFLEQVPYRTGYLWNRFPLEPNRFPLKQVFLEQVHRTGNRFLLEQVPRTGSL